MNDLRLLIGENEEILYEGKPDKKCYILESIFNPMLPIAIIWAVLDFGIMGNAMFEGSDNMIFLWYRLCCCT